MLAEVFDTLTRRERRAEDREALGRQVQRAVTGPTAELGAASTGFAQRSPRPGTEGVGAGIDGTLTGPVGVTTEIVDTGTTTFAGGIGEGIGTIEDVGGGALGGTIGVGTTPTVCPGGGPGGVTGTLTSDVSIEGAGTDDATGGCCGVNTCDVGDAGCRTGSGTCEGVEGSSGWNGMLLPVEGPRGELPKLRPERDPPRPVRAHRESDVSTEGVSGDPSWLTGFAFPSI